MICLSNESLVLTCINKRSDKVASQPFVLTFPCLLREGQVLYQTSKRSVENYKEQFINK
jgi:hypothetical protein